MKTNEIAAIVKERIQKKIHENTYEISISNVGY